MKIYKYIKEPSNFVKKILLMNIIPLSDEKYIKIMFKVMLKRKLDLSNPKTLNEKCQWIKIYDRNPLYSTLVDKYEIKNYIEKIIDKKYIIPTIGVYDYFEKINFDKLPNQFVIKCTHDSGGLVICNDKDKLDIKKSRKKINKSLKKNYYFKWREWPYKNVKPRIIIEKYMGEDLLDYKIQCFNGKVDNILVCKGRNSKRGVRYFYFDKYWNNLNYVPYDDIDLKTFTLEQPKNLDEMIMLAEKISNGFPEMRVDLYNINEKIYFGEITLFSDAGFDQTTTYEADLEMGNKLNLSIE